MNYLVFLDANAGELEKILSGVKTMVVKKCNPEKLTAHPVRPGDDLYFLRNNEECELRIKARVKNVIVVSDILEEELSNYLKEMQPRLQLTEEQYNYWSAKKQVLLVEFEPAQKTSPIQIALEVVNDRSDWIAFAEFDKIIEQEGIYDHFLFNRRNTNG
jgi:hypothetical protein